MESVIVAIVIFLVATPFLIIIWSVAFILIRDIIRGEI